MSTLPQEIVSGVLCLLPVKSLLRFRCTSKPVCSMIDDPYFTKLHLDRSAQTNSNQSLILMMDWNFPLFHIDLPSLERAVETHSPVQTLQLGNTRLLGSCNGLLCVSNPDSNAEIMLWNRSTGKQHRLPFIHTVFFHNNQSHTCFHHVAYGFGYDSVHNDYKLVRIVRFHNTLDSEVMVYSLKSNSWKKKVRGFHYDLLHKRSLCLFAEGALHWVVQHPFIVAFDLATEAFREVPPPPEALRPETFKLLWWVFEGRLCAIRSSIGKPTEIWAREHKESSWAKWLSISDPQLTFPHNIMPMAYVSNGNGLVLLHDNDKFLSYDLKTKKVKNVMIQGMPPSFEAMPYVESLVKPLPMVDATNGTRGKKNAAKRRLSKRDGFLSKGFKLVL